MSTDLPPAALPPSTPSRAEGWAVFVLAAGFVALLGALAVTESAVDWRALAAVAHAMDVLRQEDTVNLALVGFVEPPLPTLVQLPVAWLLPGAAVSGNAVWIVGALVAGLTLVVLNATAADLGVGPAPRWLLCVLVLLNPVYLGLVVTGAPDALYVLLLLGAGRHLLAWQARQLLRDLIGCSLCLSLALLTRYDAVMPIGVAVLAIAGQTLHSGGAWAKLEGTLVTFLLPIAYCGGLWVLANWLIMGDPWHFLREARHANGTPLGVGSPWVSVIGSTAAFPLLLPALWWAVWGGAHGRPRLALGPALMLASPAIAFGLHSGAFRSWLAHSEQTSLPLLPVPDLFAPVVAAGMLLTASALGDLKPMFQRKSFTKEVCLAGAGALLAAGCLLVMGDEERAYLDPRPTFVGRPLGADDATPTKTVARRLEASAPEGTLVVAGWPGYAVTLYAEHFQQKVLLFRPQPPDEPLSGPPVGALLIRDGTGFAPKSWTRALGVALGKEPEWSLEGWSYYVPEPKAAG